MRTFRIRLFMEDESGAFVNAATPKKALEKYLKSRKDFKCKLLIGKYSGKSRYSALVVEVFGDINGEVTTGFMKRYDIVVA